MDADQGNSTSRHREAVKYEDMANTDYSVLSHIISQLRPGADLSRVTLPTFILEPRSMLERITKYVAQPQTSIEKSYADIGLASWHIPKLFSLLPRLKTP
jgi:hypothetical protein